MNPDVDNTPEVEEPIVATDKKLILCWAFNVDGKEAVPPSTLFEVPYPKDDKELIAAIEKFTDIEVGKLFEVRKNLISAGGKVVSFYPQLAWECAQHLEEGDRRKIMQLILKRG